jgi:hypothetical protein
MCMKLVVCFSRTRGFDGRIFVVRTINSRDDNHVVAVKRKAM